MAMPLPGPAEGRRALTEMHDLALQLVIHAPIGAVVLADITFIFRNHQKHHWPYNVGDKRWVDMCQPQRGRCIIFVILEWKVSANALRVSLPSVTLERQLGKHSHF